MMSLLRPHIEHSQLVQYFGHYDCQVLNTIVSYQNNKSGQLTIADRCALIFEVTQGH